MMTMRTIIDLQDQQVSALKKLGKQTRLSRAELIRRAVNDYLEKMITRKSSDVFGIWQDKPENSLDFQNEIRREWDSHEGSI